MHKLLIAALLAVFSTGAMAEWTYLTSNEDKTYDVYIDKTIIKKRGNIVKMWTMTDFKVLKKSANGASYFSQKVLREYDCVEVMSSLSSLIHLSDHMGKGEVVFSSQYGDGEWQDEVPDSIGMVELKAACKK